MENGLEIKNYFSQNRITWNQFYESERRVIERIWHADIKTVLDIGCGCAGLYAALTEHFGPIGYTGVELDKEAASYAGSQYPDIQIINADFEQVSSTENTQYDIVFSLSCFDWNINLEVDPLESFYTMFRKSWKMVKPGRYMIISLRLDLEETIMDADKSYQYINYSGKKEGDLANYSVISAGDCFSLIKSVEPEEVVVYGFYGKPGVTAVTPFEKVCFAVFAIRKPLDFQKPGKEGLDILALPEEFTKRIKAYFN